MICIYIDVNFFTMHDDFHQYTIDNLDGSVKMTSKLSTQIWIEKVVGYTPKGRVYGLALEMM